MLSVRLTFVTPAYGIFYALSMNGTVPSLVPAGYSTNLPVEFVSADASVLPPPETGITFQTQWGVERVSAPPVSFVCSAPPPTS